MRKEFLIGIVIVAIMVVCIISLTRSAGYRRIDTAVNTDFANARIQAGYYYQGKGGTFSFVCSTATTASPVGGINTFLVDAAAKTNTTVVTSILSAGTPITTTCHDSATGWAIAAPLKSSTGYWCEDSTGNAERTAAPLAAGAVNCP